MIWNRKQRETLEQLKMRGLPAQKPEFFHVAGTNGKGSIGAYVSAILSAVSKKPVGHFSSPHVFSYSERIAFNGVPISEEALKKIRAAIGHVPDYFRQSFLEAMEAFRDLEYAVVEAGIGGRTDITAILQTKTVFFAVISMDHMKTLGNRIEDIAEEKAALIVPESTVYSAPQLPAVEEILRKKAKEQGARITFLTDDRYDVHRSGREGTILHFQSELIDGIYETVMPGRHQIINLSTALLFLEDLAKKKDVDLSLVRKKLIHVRLPGRLMCISKDPEIWIDGCHNDAAVDNLLKNLKDLGIEKPCMIFGMHAGKISAEKQRELFLKAGRVVHVAVENRSDEQMRKDVAEALRECQDDAPILICGSFYLLAGAKDFVERDR